MNEEDYRKKVADEVGQIRFALDGILLTLIILLLCYVTK